MNFEAVLKDLKTKRYRPVYFLQGDEAYFIDYIADYIEQNVLSEAEKSFNQLTLYGKETDVSTIVNTARRYPMMAPFQVVIVKEAQQIRDIAKLQAYTDKPSPTTILVILYKYKNIRSNSKLAKSITKNKGIVFSSPKLYENKIPAWIQDTVKSKGYKIKQDAVALIAEYLGTNLSKIANEIDKLALNVPAKTVITTQHVADNIGISKDYNFFELQKAVGKMDVTKAFKIVDYYIQNPKAAPLVVVVGSFYRYFNRLYLYHHLKLQGDAKLMEGLNLRNRYGLSEYKEAGKYFSLNRVKHILQLLYEYDLKSKGVDNVSTSQGELLKEMVIRITNREQKSF